MDMGAAMAEAGTHQGRSEEIQLISSGCCRIVWHKNKTRSAAVAAWWHSHSHLISSIKISDREGEGETESERVGDWEIGRGRKVLHYDLWRIPKVWPPPLEDC